MKQRVILTGLMGSGKTTVGKALAHQLGWKFLDTDKLVEEAAGKKVAAIFRQLGEPKFRKMETAALRRALKKSQAVIATGGGLPLSALNRRLMKAAGVTVYLRAPLRLLQKRLARQGLKKRPLLADGPKALSLLSRKRAKFYKLAAIQVQADLAPKELAKRILDRILKKSPGFYLPKQRNLDT